MILFDPREYRLIKKLAEEEKISVGELVRRAVRTLYIKKTPLSARRRHAVEFLVSEDHLPVKDWEDMERDLTDSRSEPL